MYIIVYFIVQTSKLKINISNIVVYLFYNRQYYWCTS